MYEKRTKCHLCLFVNLIWDPLPSKTQKCTLYLEFYYCHGICLLVIMLGIFLYASFISSSINWVQSYSVTWSNLKINEFSNEMLFLKFDYFFQVTDMMVANSSNLIITVKPANQRTTLTAGGPRRGSFSRNSNVSHGSLLSRYSHIMVNSSICIVINMKRFSTYIVA